MNCNLILPQIPVIKYVIYIKFKREKTGWWKHPVFSSATGESQHPQQTCIYQTKGLEERLLISVQHVYVLCISIAELLFNIL